MSRFLRAVNTLADETGLPLFLMMRQDATPRPMLPGTDKIAIECAKEGRRATVRRALRKLSFSRRYLEAVAEPGAARWSASGSPGDVVSAAHREWALKRLAQKKGAQELGHPG